MLEVIKVAFHLVHHHMENLILQDLLVYRNYSQSHIFPGAHAYQVSWQAAEVLIKTAKSRAAPTDVFLNKNSFPFLQEYYPWPVVCADNFTTIQNERGCYAKHNFGETYEIL